MATHALRNVAVLGATGSIGASALDVIARHPGRYRARVLAAGHNVDALVALCVAHRPDHAVIADEESYLRLRDGLADAGLPTQAHAGTPALDALVSGPECDTVVAAIVGAAGLSSTLAAARAGKRLRAVFSVVGNFEDAVYCWRSQAVLWPERSSAILIASGGGALGVRLGMPVHESGGIVDRPEMGLGSEAGVDHMQSTAGLVWRALLVCLFLLALLAAAGWVGR